MPAEDERGPSDAELVERANRGDSAAFEELYHRHRDWVLRLAYRISGDRDEALDILQDAFAYFFTKFPGFELSAALRTFLHPVVSHLALDRRRRRRPVVDVEVAEEIAAPDIGETGGGLGLRHALGDLSENHREVLLMRFVDDLTLDQIASATGTPLGTVKSRLHHAIKILRRRLRSGT